jgi:hypothetical protein
MSAPTACWQPFPFLDHRTCEQVEADHVEAAVNSASSIGWNYRHYGLCCERSAAAQTAGDLEYPVTGYRYASPPLHCPASPKVRSSASARSAPFGRADERLRV